LFVFAFKFIFHHRGWSAIINDSLISRTITLGVMALALFAGLLGALLSQTLVGTAYSAGLAAQPLAITGGVLGALMGLAVGMILTNAIESAVAMVFVSFAEDPASLEVDSFHFLCFLCWFILFLSITDPSQGGV
jgi:hypothetical protein